MLICKFVKESWPKFLAGLKSSISPSGVDTISFWTDITALIFRLLSGDKIIEPLVIS